MNYDCNKKRLVAVTKKCLDKVVTISGTASTGSTVDTVRKAASLGAEALSVLHRKRATSSLASILLESAETSKSTGRDLGNSLGRSDSGNESSGSEDREFHFEFIIAKSR